MVVLFMLVLFSSCYIRMLLSFSGPGQADYSYFSVDFRVKIFLKYF